MSAGFSRFTPHMPRLLFHALVWTLYCLSLRELLPPWWMGTLFPAALIVSGLAHRLRLIPALLFLALLPWLIRTAVLLVSGTAALDFDNGWLLTAPFWYFIVAAVYLIPRFPGAGWVEAVVLTGLSLFAITDLEQGDFNLNSPEIGGLQLVLTALVLLLCALCFAAARHLTVLHRAGLPPVRKRPIFSLSRFSHILGLTAALALLLLYAGQVGHDRSIQSGGGVLARNLFRFDFTDVLSLESKISLDTELALLYREDGPAVTRYLRRFTLSGWKEERGFYRDGERESDVPDAAPRPVFLPKSPETWADGGFAERAVVHQEYYLIALEPQSFFALNHPVAVEPWRVWDDASFVQAYGVKSRLTAADSRDLMKSGDGGMREDARQYYLKGGDDTYYKTLAERVAGNEIDNWSKASAIESWLRNTFYYSLKPGLAPDGDQLIWFLEQSRRGYCSYFAFAMTRLCRAAGIPARVAVGFLTNPESAVLGFTPVRSDQAHAWVEVWMGEYGWISFDPTSSIMAPDEEYTIRFISPEEWLPLVEEVLTRGGESRVVLDDQTPGRSMTASWWQTALKSVQNQPGILISVLVAMLLAAYLPGRIIPEVKNRMAMASSIPRVRSRGSWRLFAAQTIRGGGVPRLGETPLDWSRRMEEGGLTGFTRWTQYYLKAEYSPLFDANDEAESAAAAAVVRQNRQRMGRRSRAFWGAGWRNGRLW